MSVSTASGRVSATARSSQGRSATAATMPGWLQPFVEANPISVTSDALRALLTGGPARTPVLWSLAWIAGLVLVFAPLAVGRYRRLA
jgi:oleandomycin transport system permease protein